METVDSIYYRDAGKLGLSRRISASARSRMYNLMIERLGIGQSTTIVDVGVSDEEGAETNMMEKLHPWRHNIVCAGLGTGEQLLKTYPDIRFVQTTPGSRLPFSDREFDVSCANAVLEHVGGAEARRFFISEMCRVARSVFITVPNRWFPIEQHTGIPLLHWNPGLFRSALRGSRLRYWSDPANMDLLGRPALREAWPPGAKPEIVHTGLELGPFSSNLAAIWHRPQPPRAR